MALDMPLHTFLRAHPLGSPSRVVVDAAAREAAGTEDFPAPEMNAKEAMATFDRTESEALARLDPDRAVLGLLTESHTLKRYSEELDRQHQAMAGESAWGRIRSIVRPAR